MTSRIYVFDAYGTLFDVASAVMRHGEAIGDAAPRLAEIWRTKQLEYSWVRTLMGRRRDFWALTQDSLDFALAATGTQKPELRRRLLEAYEALSAYPDAAPTLRTLKDRGRRTAILSNATPAMLSRATASAGLAGSIDMVLSTDLASTFKTTPEAYRLVIDRMAVEAPDVLFVSSNRWDIAGATAFGFGTVWISRAGQPDEYPDLPPTTIVTSLAEVADL